MKLFRLTLLFSVIIFLVTCGKENNADNTISLIGEWQSKSESQIALKNNEIIQKEYFVHSSANNVTFVFKENGIGTYRTSVETLEGEDRLRTASFNYKINDNIIIIQFNEGAFNPCDQYNVDGCGLYRFTLYADELITVNEIMHEPSAIIDRSTITFIRK